MKAPVYTISLGDADISEVVERMRFEDTMGKDSMAELFIKKKEALTVLALKELISGQTVKLSFGFMSEAMSKVYSVELTDIETTYADSVSLTLRALDKGNQMKKSTSNYIWKNVTSEFVVKTIAKRYKLSYVCEPSGIVWANLPQGHDSDYEFLQKLAAMEKNGDYACYIRNTTLYFVKRALDSKSVITYTYGEDEEIISFKPTIRESNDDGSSKKTTVAGIDPDTNEPVIGDVDNDTEKGNPSLGTYKVVYDENGVKQGYRDLKGQLVQSVDDKVFKKADRTGKNVTSASTNKEEAKNIASSLKKSAALKIEEATLVVLGNPLLIVNTVLTMKGVAEQHQGNWFINEVSHEISGSGYLTTLSLQKNGTKKKTKIVSKKSNNTVGVKDMKSTVKVSVYDGNGKLISKSK